MRKAVKKAIEWIDFFMDNGININQFPLKVIKSQPWAIECGKEKIERGTVFIEQNSEHRADCIYMIVKGRVALGTYKYIEGVNFCIEHLNLGPFSILQDAECKMSFDDINYPSVQPQFDAWTSSEILFYLNAYTYVDKIKGKVVEPSERKKFGEDVYILKIPTWLTKEFFSVKELKDFWMKDIFHKYRRSGLMPKRDKSDVNDTSYATSFVRQLILIYNRSVVERMDDHGVVYIFAKNRLDAIADIPGGHKRYLTEIQRVIQRYEQKGINIIFKEIEYNDLPEKFKAIYTSVYKGQGGKPLPYLIEVVYK